MQSAKLYIGPIKPLLLFPVFVDHCSSTFIEFIEFIAQPQGSGGPLGWAPPAPRHLAARRKKAPNSTTPPVARASLIVVAQGVLATDWCHTSAARLAALGSSPRLLLLTARSSATLSQSLISDGNLLDDATLDTAYRCAAEAGGHGEGNRGLYRQRGAILAHGEGCCLARGGGMHGRERGGTGGGLPGVPVHPRTGRSRGPWQQAAT